MKRFTLITIGLLLWSSTTVYAQFNTITQNNAHCKAAPKSTLPTTSVQQLQCSLHQRRDTLIHAQIQTKAERTDRYKSVSYPLRRIVITSPYGVRTDPFTKKKARHNGLDLRANYEPAYAMMHGEVINVGKDKRSGLFVTLRHGDFTVSYCHLSKIIVIKGTYVRPGDIIALTGNTGKSTGPHLHLTLKKDGKSINPAILLKLIKHT